MLSPIDHAAQEILDAGWIRNFRYLDEVDSTNAFAKRYVSETLPKEQVDAPALFVAKRQTAGRGRSDHQWWSPDGCLMLTLVVGPDLLPSDPELWSQLALLAGVSLAEAAESLLPPLARSDVRLKWPNDLYLAGKKCGGILIESAGRHYWLIGIGFNVQVDLSMAPREVAQVATSLHNHAGRSLEPADALVELCVRLQERLVDWKSDTNSWYAPWQDHCLLSGKTVVIRMPGGMQRSGLVNATELSPETVRGICQGVDARGRLVVQTDLGNQLISAGEVVSWS